MCKAEEKALKLDSDGLFSLNGNRNERKVWLMKIPGEEETSIKRKHTGIGELIVNGESVADINPKKYSSLLVCLLSDGGGKNLFEKKTNCVILLLHKC